ncbi:MAG: tagaturonate reductase [Oscillospiraceae bacterium]|jgi:tagaturonate reductase|nr:tagaturonate reductase [Oscillospiraceae bacterium]
MDLLNYNKIEKTGFDGFLLKYAPERVLQFGEGNFLRGFADCFIDIANEKAGFGAKVVVVQPIASGMTDALNAQDGLYTLYLRGEQNGGKHEEKRLISCISRALNPYADYRAFLDCARQQSLRYIVSNTTEAGIAFDAACRFDDAPPSSFPAKLTRFLYERWLAFGESAQGFVILSCELIDDNGAELKQCVSSYADLWGLGQEFSRWLDEKNLFCSTLVDRIVTGYPAGEADALNQANGYLDRLIVTAENFGLWVIEGPEWLREELPFERAGLPVIVTADHKPYKERKVRILNGIHTSMSPLAYLAGKDTVRESAEDPAAGEYIRRVIHEEIIPTLTLPRDDLENFAAAVISRFHNPFIKHQLLSITLNSVSKWRARVLPTVRAYAQINKKPPAGLCLGFSALLQFLRGNRMEDGKLFGERNGESYQIADEPGVLEQLWKLSRLESSEYVKAVCGNVNFWGEDLNLIPGFAAATEEFFGLISEKGAAAALEEFLHA